MKWRRIIVVLFRLFVCLFVVCNVNSPEGEGGRREVKGRMEAGKFPDRIAEIILLELLLLQSCCMEGVVVVAAVIYAGTDCCRHKQISLWLLNLHKNAQK